jgi:uncharacterized membrane protein YdjX (TVP38/TMEM64 family)
MDQNPLKHRRRERIRNVFIFALLAIFFGAVFVFATVVNSESLVERLGEHNGYIIVFIVSFFAGFSAFTAVSFYSILITFISGGLNPFLLAVIVGTSLSLGDIFMFYFGRKGRDILSGRADRMFNRMSRFFLKPRREKYIPLLSYIYISFIPLPNDWLLLFLASIRYPHKHLNLIIIGGDLTHAFLITLLTAKGIHLLGI